MWDMAAGVRVEAQDHTVECHWRVESTGDSGKSSPLGGHAHPAPPRPTPHAAALSSAAGECAWHLALTRTFNWFLVQHYAAGLAECVAGIFVSLLLQAASFCYHIFLHFQYIEAMHWCVHVSMSM